MIQNCEIENHYLKEYSKFYRKEKGYCFFKLTVFAALFDSVFLFPIEICRRLHFLVIKTSFITSIIFESCENVNFEFLSNTLYSCKSFYPLIFF